VDVSCLQPARLITAVDGAPFALDMSAIRQLRELIANLNRRT
jgi:hypothetical protein